MGRSWGRLGRSWAAFGGIGPDLQKPTKTLGFCRISTPPRGLLGRLRPPWGGFGPSWSALGASWAGLGPSWAAFGSALGRLVAVLGAKNARRPRRHQGGTRRRAVIARPWGGDFWGGGERFLPWDLTRRWAPALRGRGRGGLKDASRSPPAPYALAGRLGLRLAPWKKFSGGSSQCALSVLSVLPVLAV